MNGFWWRLLDPAEREAVRGDLAESGESGIAALAQVAGLVGRRTWRPACALVAATAAAWLAVRESEWLIDLSATYLWMYLANWRAADMVNSGFWREMARETLRLTLPALLPATGSLAAGMMVSRTGRVAGSLFWLALAVANLAYLSRAPFFAYAFAVWIALVILPAMLGMRLMRHRLP